MMVSLHTRRPRLHWVEIPLPVVERMPRSPRGPNWVRTFALAVGAVVLVKLAWHLIVYAVR